MALSAACFSVVSYLSYLLAISLMSPLSLHTRSYQAYTNTPQQPRPASEDNLVDVPDGTIGTALPKMRQVGVVIIALPNLQQVWFIYTKLAVSMAVQAILGAFLAALQSPDSPGSPVFPAALQSSTNTVLVQAVLIETKIVRQG